MAEDTIPKAADDEVLAPLAQDKELLASLDSIDEAVASLSQRSPAKEGGVQSGFKALKSSIQMAAIAKHGFGAREHVYEQEGVDAVLFKTVPSWIRYQTISGCRYRQISFMDDAQGDELSHANAGVTFFGYPGASGWADKVGDVAIHYLHHSWAVFSKVFPFSEQQASLSMHEDLLLLGSTKHVMLTPLCARAIGEGGLRGPDTDVTLLNSEGLCDKVVSASTLPVAVRHRLYLTWGHQSNQFSSEVASFARPLQELIDEAESTAHKMKRWMSSLFAARIKVGEKWMRYPGAPIDPAYYSQLLAMATSMSQDEERTRELLEPQPSARAASPQSASSQSVKIDVNTPGSAGSGKVLWA